MTTSYEEILEGASLLRVAPRARHEVVCGRLHARVGESLRQSTVARLLPPRSAVALAADTSLRPDLALVTAATCRVWLVAEVIDPQDHDCDTVTKKAFYEDLRVPRLWMVDPRYDNVEVYHGTAYGLMLKGILAGQDVLAESLLPGLAVAIADLFLP